MTYSIAGLVAELGDLRKATTFELKGLKACQTAQKRLEQGLRASFE